MRLKYYLRGLGIGILVTTVILMIAFARHPAKMSDAEIIARAKELGMVMEEKTTGGTIPKATEQETEKQQPIVDTSQPEDTKQPAGDTEGQADTDTELQAAEVSVVKGDTSNSVAVRLYVAGLVADAEEFNNYLMEHGYADSILPGTVEIPAGADYEQIAQILVNPR